MPATTLVTVTDIATNPGKYQDKLDRLAVMADAAWGLGDFTLYTEAQLRWGRETAYWMHGMDAAEAFSANSRNQVVLRALGGVMYQLDLGLTRPISLLAEYFYQGDGLSKAEAASYRSHYQTWQAGIEALSASDSADTVAQTSASFLPPAFYGIGAFRKQYGALVLNSIALDRYLLMNASLIAGLDSGFVMGHVGIGYDFAKGTSISLGWDVWTAQYSAAEQATELLMIPYRNRLSVSISTGF